ncbi:MAG: valine--tRNA ligase [Acidobacteriota bacterium]
MEKSYNPGKIEEEWYRYWEQNKFFQGDIYSEKKIFSMVIPPPNITGSLHMGHALTYSLPDVIVRWKRKQGFDTMWLPGFDHAGIATQIIVEKELLAQGVKKEDLGEEKFLEKLWEWKKKSKALIANQLRRLGCSLDWSRERFTLDEGLSRAVRKVFVSLYREGLIYRDYYLVNWCPRCRTAISDLEVINKQKKGKLYYIKYPIIDGSDFIVVATTRPETMLGDTAIAVNPEDPKYINYAGKKAILPLVGRILPIIHDERVEKEFGTGAVKVTPAHDPLDFEIGKNKNLEIIKVIDESGKMNMEAGQEFYGLDRIEARERIVKKLKEQKFLMKIEDYEHSIGHCQRCDSVIEYNLSWQWFMKVKPLAERAVQVVKEGRTKFIPENWEKIYFDWMENIHDWCISRQIWWGHRLPVWYCKECNEIIVDEEPPIKCSKCKNSDLRQEKDVLDTWFSSALWPFSTLGWPDKTEDLKRYYPTDLLITGFDIIFFWVARMIMMGMKFLNGVPFRKVFINGLIRDEHGQKMSKSKGNIVDPIDAIDEFGVDALRFTLVSSTVAGMDIALSKGKIFGYKTFVNKIWNASRFVLMNYRGEDLKIMEEELTLPDKWIRSKLNGLVKRINHCLENFLFHEACEEIYHFIWHQFCDWYVEMVKLDLKKRKITSLSNLIFTLKDILNLLHPFMPFVTEEIYQKLPNHGISICVSEYPKERKEFEDIKAEEMMDVIIETVKEIRKIRVENRIPPQKKVEVYFIPSGEEIDQILHKNIDYIQLLVNAKGINFVSIFPEDKRILKGACRYSEAGIFLHEVEDLEGEKLRLKKEIEKINREMLLLEERMKNKDFIEKAPQKIISETHNRYRELTGLKKKLEDSLTKF